MIKIPKNYEKTIPKAILDKSIEYCESIGADEISNIATLGDNDFRIMYFFSIDGVRKMSATILPLP